MRYLYVCNTSSDSVSEIDLNGFCEINKLRLSENNVDRVGPHGICSYKDYILTANNYSNDVCIINKKDKNQFENYFIGMHCNDVKVVNGIAYVVCGDSNVIITFDIENKKVLEQIPCGSLPHSIDIDRRKNIMVVSNMQDDSVTLIDCNKNNVVKKIRVGAYPTKATFSVNGDYIFVCESNIGFDCKGSLSIISLKTFNILNRVKLGNSPVDMYCDERFCYACNFGDGSISIIDINNSREISLIQVGGMPRGIIRVGGNLYVGDNYNNLLLEVDIKSQNKKAISIGGEPTGMTLS